MDSFSNIVELISTPALLVDSELKIFAVNACARASFPNIREGILLSESTHSDLWDAALRHMRRGKMTNMVLRDELGAYSVEMLPLAGDERRALVLLSRDLFGVESMMRAMENMKEPLLTIRNLVDIINRSPEVFDKGDLSIVDMLRRNIYRSLTLLAQASFVMRPEFTEFPELTPCDLSVAVDTVIKAVSLSVAGSDLKMITEISRGLYVKGSPEYLERVAVCLIANALRYAKTTLTVRTYKCEDMAYLSVADDGAGVPPEDLPYIYAPWFSPGMGDGYDMGYGLLAAKSIANGLKGDIGFVSGDEGSTATIKLPLYTGGALSSTQPIARASAEYGYSVEAADALHERKSRSGHA